MPGSESEKRESVCVCAREREGVKKRGEEKSRRAEREEYAVRWQAQDGVDR